MKHHTLKILTFTFFLFGSMVNLYAEGMQSTNISSILEVQQYYRAIHIMAMLLLGFGFLMVFVKKIWTFGINGNFSFSKRCFAIVSCY
jgi:ammonium transporter Rh